MKGWEYDGGHIMLVQLVEASSREAAIASVRALIDEGRLTDYMDDDIGAAILAVAEVLRGTPLADCPRRVLALRGLDWPPPLREEIARELARLIGEKSYLWQAWSLPEGRIAFEAYVQELRDALATPMIAVALGPEPGAGSATLRHGDIVEFCVADQRGYLRVIEPKLAFCEVFGLLRSVGEPAASLEEMRGAGIAFVVKVKLDDEPWSVRGNLPLEDPSRATQLGFWRPIVGKGEVVSILNAYGLGEEGPIEQAYDLERFKRWSLSRLALRLRGRLDGDDAWSAKMKSELDEKWWYSP
ncbi:MAG: hypothetical protein DRJ42_11595 [Deltaproteobacteria bacterium]|nr:MAG: hypothetical protein DRJ42_11595 [Deltaproteobacteria bacterium]